MLHWRLVNEMDAIDGLIQARIDESMESMVSDTQSGSRWRNCAIVAVEGFFLGIRFPDI
jgi:hypothetical protein